MIVTAMALAAASVPPPPPVVDGERDPDVLVALDFDGFVCGGRAVYPVRKAAILSQTINRHRLPREQRVPFTIDAQGRTVDIDPPHGIAGEDIAPAIAATRFSPGPVRHCEARVTARSFAWDAVPQQVAARYFTLPSPDRRKHNILAQMSPPGSDCGTDRPHWLVRAQPDFDRLDGEPGLLSYIFMTFAIDAAGTPQAIAPAFSSGNAALTQAGLAAMARWRFQPGHVKTGCTYGFWQGSSRVLAAPPLDPALPDHDCPDSDFAYMPALSPYFPDAFEARGIEGRVRLRYSAAPWGEIGDVEILASEPATAFGEAGKRLLSHARLEHSDAARVGCTVDIKFAMPPRGDPPET